jgi:hypothetical protein
MFSSFASSCTLFFAIPSPPPLNETSLFLASPYQVKNARRETFIENGYHRPGRPAKCRPQFSLPAVNNNRNSRPPRKALEILGSLTGGVGSNNNKARFPLPDFNPDDEIPGSHLASSLPQTQELDYVFGGHRRINSSRMASITSAGMFCSKTRSSFLVLIAAAMQSAAGQI